MTLSKLRSLTFHRARQLTVAPCSVIAIRVDPCRAPSLVVINHCAPSVFALVLEWEDAGEVVFSDACCSWKCGRRRCSLGRGKCGRRLAFDGARCLTTSP